MRLLIFLIAITNFYRVFSQTTIEMENGQTVINSKSKFINENNDTFINITLVFRLYTHTPTANEDNTTSFDFNLIPTYMEKNRILFLNNKPNTDITITFNHSDWTSIPTGSGSKTISKNVTLHLSSIGSVEKINDIYIIVPNKDQSGMGYNPSNKHTVVVTKNFVSEEKKENAILDNVMFLNAYNFDFDNTTKNKFLFHVNIYKSQLSDNHCFGINAGMMKINYLKTYSSQNFIFENIPTKTFSSPQIGEKYYKRLIDLDISVKNTNFSMYMQPLCQISGVSEVNKIFIHGHIEFLANTWKTKLSFKTIHQDTLIYNDTSNITMNSGFLDTSEKTYDFINGYFGAGLTFDLKIHTKLKLFVQGTIGFTSNFPNHASVNQNPFIPILSRTSGFNGFYLIRSYLKYRLSETEIVLGTDLRGLMPQKFKNNISEFQKKGWNFYNPFYANYIGINVSLESVLDLLK